MRCPLRLCHDYGDFTMGGLRRIEHRLADQLDTRIGDNDVQMLEALEGRREEPIDVAYLRDIRLDRDPCPAQPLDGSNRLLRLLFALGIVHDDACSEPAESFRDGSADTARGTCNQSYLVSKMGHGASLKPALPLQESGLPVG